MFSIIDRATNGTAPRLPNPVDIPLQRQPSPLNAKNLDRFFQTKFGIALQEVMTRLNTVKSPEAFEALIRQIVTYEWQHRSMLANQVRLRIMLDDEVQNANNIFKQSILGIDHQNRSALELIASTLSRFKQKAGLETAFHIQHH